MLPALVRPPRTLEPGWFEHTAGLRAAILDSHGRGQHVPLVNLHDDPNELGLTPRRERALDLILGSDLGIN